MGNMAGDRHRADCPVHDKPAGGEPGRTGRDGHVRAVVFGRPQTESPRAAHTGRSSAGFRRGAKRRVASWSDEP